MSMSGAGSERSRRHARTRGHSRRAVRYGTVAVGYAPVVASLAAELRRGTYHGLSVVAACLAGPPDQQRNTEIAGIPAVAGLGSVRM